MQKFIITLIVILSFNKSYSQREFEVTFERKKDKSISFYYQKKIPGSYSLKVEFTELENCSSKRVFKKVVKYNSGYLFTLKPSNPSSGISLNYQFSYSLGNPNPKINEDIVYLLPFQKEKNVKIFETLNVVDKYLKKENSKWKSFVAYPKESDTIFSMRKGVVVKIIDKYVNNEKNELSTTTNRNSLIVEHEDGTYARYKGFDKNKFFVKLGQKIYPHTPLGSLEKFNADNYRFDFGVFFFLENRLSDKKSTLKDSKDRVKYIDPNFFIDNKITKINSGENHQVSFSEEVKLQEFSRREKKKYKKNPSIFK